MAYFRSLTFMTDGRTPTQSLFNMLFKLDCFIEAVQVSISCLTCFQACKCLYEMENGRCENKTHVSVFLDQPYFDCIVEVRKVMIVGVNPTVSNGDSTERYIKSWIQDGIRYEQKDKLAVWN